MARTPTVYRWDDPGAPDLNAIMPTNNDKNKLFIHTVLKACLVDGYGSKAAAGWTMPHEEIVSNGCRFVLTNTANSGSLLYEGGVFSGGSTDLRSNTVWACSEVESMDAPVDAWSHKTKYENRSNGANGEFHKTGLYQGSTCNAWVVIANENTAIFVSGRSDVEFNVNSTGAAAASIAAEFMFGSMHDGNGLLNPVAGNFYIAGGMPSGYTRTVWWGGFQPNLISSYVDIIGLTKAQVHFYTYREPSPQNTVSPLSAWLPIPYVYMQYGPSGPDGAASDRLHFSVALPSCRSLLLRPKNVTSLNAFMVSNGFEYGKAFSYQGNEWVVVKEVTDVVQVFSLAPSEWGV
jgi:hypothetical protein